MPQQILRPRQDVRFRIIDREAVVLRQEAAETMVLNEVGARILELLDGRTAVAEVIDQLEQEFAVDRAELEIDCHKFVDHLTQRGVLEELPDDR